MQPRARHSAPGLRRPGYSYSPFSAPRETSIVTVTIPSRRNAETDFGSQPDTAETPFWVPAAESYAGSATGGTNAGFQNAAYGSGFPASGFDSGGFGGSFASAPFGSGQDGGFGGHFGKKGRGKGSTHKGKAPAGKSGGRPNRPGVDVRCPACGFLRNKREHAYWA